jgi:hypothetical protein
MLSSPRRLDITDNASFTYLVSNMHGTFPLLPQISVAVARIAHYGSSGTHRGYQVAARIFTPSLQIPLPLHKTQRPARMRHCQLLHCRSMPLSQAVPSPNTGGSHRCVVGIRVRTMNELSHMMGCSVRISKSRERMAQDPIH